MRNLVLAGNAQQVIARMNAYVDLGVTEFVFNWACDPKDVEDQMRRLAAPPCASTTPRGRSGVAGSPPRGEQAPGRTR